MKLQRIWTKANQSNLIWWEFGDEQWYLLSDKTIHHIKILSRKVLSKDPFTLVEEGLLLPETPVPLEATEQEAKGWQVIEQVLPEKKKPLLPLPQTQNSKKPQQAQSLLNYTPPEQDLRLARGESSELVSEFVEGEPSQFAVSLPTELWLSLSQWIPPNALFQPSLHHQAILELSDKPIQTFVAQRNYSRPQPTRHHHHSMRNDSNRYGVNSRDPHEVSSHKQRVYRQDYSAKPLFI
jgi:hypothetical protein